MDENPREMFGAICREYKVVYEEFVKFRRTILFLYKDAIDSFLHDANRCFSNVAYCLEKDELPEQGRPSLRWKDYNDLNCDIGIMRLILDLIKEGGGRCWF